jgi:crotonobetainyl-CoA:carnitine CoA-transferase CaiB-like acyl-CoA transferase
MQAEAGLMNLTGDPAGDPVRFGTSVIDYMTGVTGMLGLLGAVRQAQATGQGCDVDVSLFDVALHLLSYAGTWYLNQGHASGRLPRGSHLSVTPVQTFPSADGWIYVMCMTDKFWHALLDVIGNPVLKEDPRFKSNALRNQHRDELTAALDAEFRKQPTSYWLKALTGVLPISPVLTVEQALQNPFLEEIDVVRSVPHPRDPEMKLLGIPLKYNGERLSQRVCRPLDQAETLTKEPLKKSRTTSHDRQHFFVRPTVPTRRHHPRFAGAMPSRRRSAPGSSPTWALKSSKSSAKATFARRYDSCVNGLCSHFVWVNHSKESLALDLKSLAAGEVVARLLDQTDVFVQNLAPGAAARLGLSAAALQKSNPRLIVCDISGYGNGGPYGDRKVYDLLIQSESGFLSMTGTPTNRPKPALRWHTLPPACMPTPTSSRRCCCASATANMCSTRARALNLLRFFARLPSSVSSPLHTRWLVKSLACGAAAGISAFWLA